MVIVFEGIDGSGKDTQIELLEQHFKQQGKRVISINTSRGYLEQHIDSKLSSNSISKLELANLFLAHQHSYLPIIEDYNKDGIVLLNRWLYSTIVYGTTNSKEATAVVTLAPHVYTDKRIYIDTPVNIALQRLKQRDKLDYYEKEDILNKVYTKYKDIVTCYNFISVDGTKSKEEIHKEILELL